MSVGLSRTTVERLDALFEGADRDTAEKLLVADCADNLPFMEKATAASLERIRFAVLKLSGGNLDRLLDAIALAQTDWRDALMAAGFGDDVDAHLAWHPGRGTG